MKMIEIAYRFAFLQTAHICPPKPVRYCNQPHGFLYLILTEIMAAWRCVNFHVLNKLRYEDMDVIFQFPPFESNISIFKLQIKISTRLLYWP